MATTELHLDRKAEQLFEVFKKYSTTEQKSLYIKIGNLISNHCEDRITELQQQQEKLQKELNDLKIIFNPNYSN